MRHLYLAAGFLVLASMAVCPWAKAGSMDSEAEVRELARQVLDGRQAVVRLYVDWKANPKAYTTLNVPLDGLDVTFDAVAQAAGRSVPDDAVVVVAPDDQQDTLIADVMGGCLFGEPCRTDGRITLWPGHIPPVQRSPCLFQDALRQPIANAEVEILLSDYPMEAAARYKLWIANAKLDENGRMKSLKASGSCLLGAFLFVVHHPDCGPAVATSYYSSSKPGEDHRLSINALPKDKWCVFVDALGKPMAGATVQVVPHQMWQQGQQGSWPAIVLDEAGRLRPGSTYSMFVPCCFLVHDPDYGIGIVEPWNGARWRDEIPSRCVVPVVAAGTSADERSVWGAVVDVNDEPVPEAVIECREVRTAGGGSLPVWWPQPLLQNRVAKVLTDPQGRFAMHLPLADTDGKLGRPVPPGASYSVTIFDRSPAWGFQQFDAYLAAGQEHKIVLQSKSQAFRGAIVFQDERGPVTDPEKLKQVTLSIRTPMADGRAREKGFAPGGWMETNELPLGIYRATAEWDGKIYEFEPIEVTAQSPETLVFTPRQITGASRPYYGRVVHGITGRPIAGALVMQRPLPGVLGTTEQEQELTAKFMSLGPEIAPDGEISALLESYPALGLTRTDASGRFETAMPTTPSAFPYRSLIAMQKDFLGAEQRLSFPLSGRDENGQRRLWELEPDATGKVQVPDMRLFPAGCVIVEVNVPARDGRIMGREVRFRYTTTAGDPTPWLKDLWATPVGNQGGTVFCRDRLPTDESQIVYVPADVTLTLTFAVLSGDEQLSPIMIRNVRLRQGQVLDLGRMEFSTGIQIAVRVVDSKGKPVEGIAVKSHTEESGYGRPGATTDGQGLARIAVPPHSRGRFYVERFDKETMKMVREDVPYEIAGPEDAGREFVLPLSEGFLEQLLDAQ